MKNIETIPLNNNLYKTRIKLQNIYNYKTFFKIIFKIKYNAYLFFILSYFLYYKSLESCTKGEDACTKMKDWIKSKVKEAIFSLLIMVILFELIIYKIISRSHLIHIIFNFTFFYLYSHGLNFEDHGLYNLTGYFILFIIFIYKKKEKKIIVIFIYYNIYFFINFIHFFI